MLVMAFMIWLIGSAIMQLGMIMAVILGAGCTLLALAATLELAYYERKHNLRIFKTTEARLLFASLVYMVVGWVGLWLSHIGMLVPLAVLIAGLFAMAYSGIASMNQVSHQHGP